MNAPFKKKKKKCGHFRKIAIPWKSVELLGSVDGTGKNGKMNSFRKIVQIFSESGDLGKLWTF